MLLRTLLLNLVENCFTKTVKATLDNEEATEVTLAIEWAENEEFDASS